MYIALIAAVIAGVIIGLLETRKMKPRKGAHLKGLEDDETPCSKAFENLKLVNSWWENLNAKN